MDFSFGAFLDLDFCGEGVKVLVFDGEAGFSFKTFSFEGVCLKGTALMGSVSEGLISGIACEGVCSETFIRTSLIVS